MKKLYLLCTKPWIYLSEIPLVVLLVLAIIFNNTVDGVWKLYPLIITTIVGILFILVYFFKVIILTTDEVEVFSVFTERDSATLNQGKTLIIGRISSQRIKVCVFGNDGKPPEFDFIEEGSDYTPIDIFLLRAKALGGVGTLVRIMGYFDIPTDEAKKLTNANGSYEDDLLSAVSSADAGGYQEIKITFKKTI